FRLGLGVKQMLTPNFGAKIFYYWENTNRLTGSFAPAPHIGALIPTIDTDFYNAQAKNNQLIGFGLFYQLCPSIF
ncbi:MAG TPA: hypothetical protein VFP93_04255, partial [Gammaproteobacteria bacterium]|nr:hypothetical protein [Gammaproteobacteria bacterium]